VETIPRSWFAAIAAVFLFLSLVPLLLRPSVTLTADVSSVSGTAASCISPWSRMTNGNPQLIYAPHTLEAESTFAAQCEEAIDGRQNVAVGLLLLAGIFGVVFIASVIRRQRVATATDD
jgi:hypothetical protein